MKLVGQGQLSMGVCYYPDHWDEHFWKEDIEKMLDCGLTTIRIAENAWGKIEPRENVFDYSFYDRFLELVEKTDMKVIFGTPTATPPAWLTEKYPEVLNRTIDGVQFRHGGRKHYKNEAAWLFVLNYTDQEQRIRLHRRMWMPETEKWVEGEQNLRKYEAAVYRLE